jgi:hypothetical protein
MILLNLLFLRKKMKKSKEKKPKHGITVKINSTLEDVLRISVGKKPKSTTGPKK